MAAVDGRHERDRGKLLDQVVGQDEDIDAHRLGPPGIGRQRLAVGDPAGLGQEAERAHQPTRRRSSPARPIDSGVGSTVLLNVKPVNPASRYGRRPSAACSGVPGLT